MTTTRNIIRNIYVYLVTLIGLVMLVIALVDLIQLGLKTWVFTLADEQNYYENMPPEPYFLENYEMSVAKDPRLTESDRQAIDQWKKDYESWRERQEKVDYKKAQRQRSAVRDIAMLVVGLGLFLSHGYIVRKDRKIELKNS